MRMLLILLLLTLFLLVLLGFYVFVAAPRSRPHQTFAAFVACLIAWTVKDIALWGFYGHDGAAGWWASVSFTIALLLQYSLIVFAWVFPEDEPIPFSHAATLFAPGVVLTFAALVGWMWDDVSFVDGKFAIRLTPLAYAYGLYVYGLFAYGFRLIFSKYRRYRGTPQQSQLGAILWALVITGSLNTLANILLPLLGIYTLLPIGSVFMLAGVVIYAYAISNFKLFSFQSALDQFRLFPIAYKVALSIAGIAVFSFVCLQIPIVWWSFEAASFDEWRRFLVFSCIAALAPNLLLVALVIRIISRPLRRVTEAAVAVAGGEYGAQVPLSSNDEVGVLANSFNSMSSKLAADREQQRKLTEHLIRSERLAAAGTLAAGVAHEVNNPLASISSLLQLLQNANLAATDREMLGLMSTQIARISQVLRDLMDFAQRRPPSRQPLDIVAELETSLRLASFDKTFRSVQIERDFDPKVPLIAADANQLQQVFLNLLLNARDALPDGGTLTLRTRWEDEVVIEFSDTGYGIAPEHRSQIFDPFFTTKPAGKGTGLGLAVCYSIITAHGGRLEVHPNTPHGTCVRVMLPHE